MNSSKCADGTPWLWEPHQRRNRRLAPRTEDRSVHSRRSRPGWRLGLASLKREGVDTAFVARKAGPHTSFALRAQLPPDHPLVFFRHDPADIHLSVIDAAALPIDQAARC